MSPTDLLAFERRWWRYPGRKEQAIREEFGVSPIRYYQALAAALRDPATLAIDAATVRRLQRVTARAARHRAA